MNQIAQATAKRNAPPGPRPTPILGWRGNALRFFRNPIEYMTELYKDHGNVTSLVDGGNPPLFTEAHRNGNGLTVFGFGHEVNKEILSQADIFINRRPRGPKTDAYNQISKNVIFENGEKHTATRRLLMPAFTMEHLKRYHSTMVEETENMLRRWQPGQQIDMLAEANWVGMKISTWTLFGLQATEGSIDLGTKIRETIAAQLSPVAMVPFDLPGTPYRNLRKRMEQIHQLLLAEINKKRAVTGTDGDDALSMMIRAFDEEAGQLTNDELVSNVFIIFFAGHETASSALTWTLMLLAQHPDVTAALCDELSENLGGEPPTYEQAYELPFLDSVVKESLRILPPAVFFPRVTTIDTTLGNFEIPAESEVVYSAYITHRDPDIFAEPDRFLPSRWESLKTSPFEYLPFGAGPHRCLGAYYASVELRIQLAMILQRFRLEMAANTKVDLSIFNVMSPKGGLPMIVRQQDRAFKASKTKLSGYVRKMVKF